MLRTSVILCVLLMAIAAIGCDSQSTRSATAPSSSTAATYNDSSVAADDLLANAPLPTSVISLNAAKRSVNDFRWDEWQQLRRVFRFTPSVLAAWEERQDDWQRMHEASDDRVAARIWLLSGLRPEQQQYWAQWVFYRIAVRNFSEDTSRGIQLKCWEMAKPYAKRQMERNYVEEDPYLRDISEEAASYRARVNQILGK
ncbi:MAG: hypothetical protein EA401_10040 [Planctomycetota bacterium]|nr:MAG: hypothetical protein EA401_10040 [Planctomycetota bacterium]